MKCEPVNIGLISKFKHVLQLQLLCYYKKSIVLTYFPNQFWKSLSFVDRKSDPG